MMDVIRLQEIRNRAVKLLARAQTIRIQQVQATNEANWSPTLKRIGHQAWKELNEESEAIEAELGKMIAEFPK